MSESFINESIAVMFSLIISWSFGIWVFLEWRNYEIKRKMTMAMFMAIVIPVFGSIYPAIFLNKCYYQSVLRSLTPEKIACVTVGSTQLNGDLKELTAALNDSQWYVPNEQGKWSELVRNGGAPFIILDKNGRTYKFKVGYYYLGKALIRLPGGGFALSADLPKALQDLNAPLP